MLGYLVGITLVLGVLSPLILSEVFADYDDPEITLLYADKKLYTDKDLIKISA